MKLIQQNLKIPATAGKKYIWDSKFFYWIDNDFKNWNLNVPSNKTKNTNVAVGEITKDGTFEQFFKEINTDLDKLILTQEQILVFIKKHKKWLRTDGYGTFFLFKVGDEFFVAGVGFIDDGQLLAYVCRFSGDSIWYAERRHRIVVPQLALNRSVSSISDPLISETLPSELIISGGGQNKMFKQTPDNFGKPPEWKPCPRCGSDGRVWCSVCSGTNEKMKNLTKNDFEKVVKETSEMQREVVKEINTSLYTISDVKKLVEKERSRIKKELIEKIPGLAENKFVNDLKVSAEDYARVWNIARQEIIKIIEEL